MTDPRIQRPPEQAAVLDAGPTPANAASGNAKWWTLVAVCLGTFMLLLDITIVNVALPDIQSALGSSFSGLQWVIDAYALSLAALLLTAGSLADMYGRRLLYIIGLFIFTGASLLCGVATSTLMLQLSRGLQGVGGAIMFSVSLALLASAFHGKDRGVAFGVWGAITGLAVAIGPLLGGGLTSGLSWRWIFYVNLPIGAIALAVIGVAFHARSERVPHKVDYLGAGILAGGLASIVLFTSLGGNTYAWSSPAIIVMAAVGVALLVAFPFIEQRAAEPILPLELFRNRVFTVTSAVGFIVSLALFGAITYLPLYLQIARGYSPTSSGLFLTPLMGGLLVTSILSGQLISRYGRYKPFPIAGTAIMTAAVYLLSGLALHTPIWHTILAMIVLGLGLGMVMQVLILAAQNAVDYRLLGVATSGSTLFRQVGGSIGVSAFGAIFSNRLASELSAKLPHGTHIPTAANPDVVKHLPPAIHAPYIQSFVDALQPVFLAATGVSLLAFLLTWLLREVPLRQTSAGEGVAESIPPPRDDDSERELERIVAAIVRGDTRTRIYRQLIARADIELLLCQGWARFQCVEDDACELSFEAADRFASAFPFRLFAFEVGPCVGVVTGLCDRDPVEGAVELAVAAAVEAVPLHAA